MREPTLTSARKKEKRDKQERHLQLVTQRKCGSNNLKGDYCVPKEAVQEGLAVKYDNTKNAFVV